MSTRDEPTQPGAELLGPEDDMDDTQLLSPSELDERLTVREALRREPEKMEERR
jgi:hypothetical protein